MKAFLALISLVFCAGLATAQEVSPGKNGKRPEPKPVQTVLFKVDKESGKVFAAVVDRPNMTQEDLKTLASSNEIKFEEIPQKLVATSRDELDKDAAHSAWYWAYWSGGMYWGGAYYNPYWYGYGYGYYNYYAYNWYGSYYPWRPYYGYGYGYPYYGYSYPYYGRGYYGYPYPYYPGSGPYAMTPYR